MDAAALSMKVDTTSVLQAANDLDRFTASAKKAGAAAGGPTGSIAKLVATVQSMNSKLDAVVGSLNKISNSMSTMANASQAAAKSQQSVAAGAAETARSFSNADSHVNAYRQHLQSLVTQLNATRAASAALGASSGSPITLGSAAATTELQKYLAAVRAIGPANDNAASTSRTLSAAQEKLSLNVRTATADIRAQIDALRDLSGSSGGGSGGAAGSAAASLGAAFNSLEAAANAAAAALRSIDAAGGGGSGGGGNGGGSSRSSSSPYYGASGIEATGQAAQLASHHAQNLLFQLNDIFVSLASGQKPMMVFIQQGSQIAQIYSQAGMGVKGFALGLANMLGLLKTTTAAAEAAALAQATQATASVAAANAQATAAVRAAETNIAIARTQVSMATTATEAAAAEARLAVALDALSVAQAEAAITGRTLTRVQQEQAAAAAAARGATVTSMTAIGVAVAGVVAVLALAVAGIAALTSQANDDSGLKKYTTAMGYTKAEVAKLNAVTVTFGDTFKAVFQVGMERIAKAFGLSTADIKSMWSTFLDWLATATRATLAGVYAGIAGTLELRQNVIEDTVGGDLGWETFARGYRKRYNEAQKFMDDVVGQAQKNAQTRQNAMAKAMYDKPAAGAHQYGFSDLLKEALKMQNDLNKAAAQIGLYGEALARVNYEQELFNKAAEHNLKLTPQQAEKIKALAASMAALSEQNRTLKFMEDFKQQTINQVAALDTAIGAIGLHGAALATYTYEQEQLNKALADHITLSQPDRDKISRDADIIGVKTYDKIIKGSRDSNNKWHGEQMRQLEAERGALNLTGKELIAYSYRQELVNKALADGVSYADLNINQINRQAEAYATTRHALDKMQEIANVKSRGLDSLNSGIVDAITGVKSLGSAFKDVANQIIADLLRIAVQRSITEPLANSLFGSGSSSGILSSILSSIGGGNNLGGVSASSMSAINSQYAALSTPRAFANGGAFTNSVVNTPTLFRFAKGSQFGLMGEAGPEAVMPLARGANGKLGVQSHGGGGGRSITIGDIHQEIKIDGGFTPETAVAMIRQNGEQVIAQIKRDLQSMLHQLDTDGTFAS